MKIKRYQHEGIKFLSRAGTSDEKTFKEVVVKDTYQRRYFKLQQGEHWKDLGGNVGAFTLKALANGCTVETYEADPISCEMIRMNLEANGWKAQIHQKAVVASDFKKMKMYIGNNNNVWRNSLYRNWGNEAIEVPCVNFRQVIKSGDNIKMDIEGAEMDILESMEEWPNKMVFEWSFDIDPDIDRYRAIVEKLKQVYPNVHAASYNPEISIWPESWFPPCTNVYCYHETD